MFACFLEECKQMSATPEERKDHCIRIHRFPSNFRFETSPAVLSKGKKERKDSQQSDVAMEETSKSEVASKVPKNFSFGHQKQKGFDSKSYARILARKHKKETEMECENVSALEDSKTVEDLMESLPS